MVVRIKGERAYEVLSTVPGTKQAIGHQALYIIISNYHSGSSTIQQICVLCIRHPAKSGDTKAVGESGRGQPTIAILEQEISGEACLTLPEGQRAGVPEGFPKVTLVVGVSKDEKEQLQQRCHVRKGTGVGAWGPLSLPQESIG